MLQPMFDSYLGFLVMPEDLDKTVVQDSFCTSISSVGLSMAGKRYDSCFWVTFIAHLLDNI
jgi:hypothetical protein